LCILAILVQAKAVGQVLTERDSVPQMTLSTGWADEAVSIGYVATPSVLVLKFVSGLVNDWNAGYFGIPASAMIIASGILGSASIVAMTSYAFSRADTARKMQNQSYTSWNIGIAPLKGGAMASVVYRF